MASLAKACGADVRDGDPVALATAEPDALIVVTRE
jgi:hypothetical protein